MRYFYLIILLVSFQAFAQKTWDDFSGEERAFLFHSARRTAILNTNVFNLFEFTDSILYIRDTLPDYSYIEREVVKDPDKLVWHKEGVNRKSDGVINDLVTRLALRELDQILHYRNSTAEEDKPLKVKLKRFEKFVLEEVPQNAVRTLNSGEYTLVESLQGYYSPSLSVSDKLAALVNTNYGQLDQMLIVNAIMSAQEKYVNTRVNEFLVALGIEGDAATNYLSAVGDGAGWSDLKGGIRTPYDKGLPDEKGLFRFVVEEKEKEETTKKYLSVKPIIENQFKTNAVKETVVHADVFGYHEERQITLVIQKGGNSYVLYGKNDTRLVSPDSSYGEGVTYWRLMYNLEFVHIAQLKEDLYGKRGYEYQIDLYEKMIESTLLKIKNTEYRLDKLRHTPEGKPKIKKKKLKKKNMGTSDQAGTGHPTSAMSKLDKKKNIEQNRLVQLNGQLSSQKMTLKKLKEEMEKAYILLARYETKLDFMKKTMGYNIMTFEEKNGIYTFNDGAYFDYETQDFVFPGNRSEDVFRIIHISFGKDVFTSTIEENFMHINVSQRESEEKYILERKIRAVELNQLTSSDSIQLLDLFYQLARTDRKLNCKAVAGGIRAEAFEDLYRDSLTVSEPFSADQKRLPGSLKIRAIKNQDIVLSITAFEDKMIPSNFDPYNGFFQKMKAKYPEMNEIDVYSGVVAKYEAERFIDYSIQCAEKWIKIPEDKKKVIAKLKKAKFKKVYFESSKKWHKVPGYVR